MKALIVGLAVVVAASPALAIKGLPYAREAVVHEGRWLVSGGISTGRLPDTEEAVDILMYGARLGYGLTDGLELSGGLGMLNLDLDFDVVGDDDPNAPEIDVDPDFDNEPYFQIGVLYTLPLDLPFDIGLRGAVGYASLEESNRDSDAIHTPAGPATVTMEADFEIDILSINAGLLASKSFNPVLSLYGFCGVSYTRTSFDFTGRGSSDNPAVMAMIELQGDDRRSVSETETTTDLAVAGGMIVNLGQRLSLYGEVAHIDEIWGSVGARLTF